MTNNKVSVLILVSIGLLLGQIAIYLPETTGHGVRLSRSVVLVVDTTFRAGSLIASIRVLLARGTPRLDRYALSLLVYFVPLLLLRLESDFLLSITDSLEALIGLAVLVLTLAAMTWVSVVPWSLVSGGSVRDGLRVAKQRYGKLSVAVVATLVVKVALLFAFRQLWGNYGIAASCLATTFADLLFLLLVQSHWLDSVRVQGFLAAK